MNAPAEPSRTLVAGLRGLLSMLEHSPEPLLHASTWQARLGADTVTSLVRLGILVDRGQADWYRCGGPRGSGCPRRVVPNLGSSAHPFVAVCGRGDGSCESVYLEQADLQLLGFSSDAFVHRLRLAFGLSGAVDDNDAGFPETRRIGELGGRSVFLATSAGIPGFEAWLAARGEAIVMVPVGRWLPTVTRDRFAAGQRTELVVLGEVLELVEGAIVVRARPAAGNLVVNDSGAASYLVREPVVCVVHDNDGVRELTAGQYRELVAGAEEYDLFVDLTDVTKGGGYRAGKRDLDGNHEDVVLTRNEAAVVVELATSGRALRPGEFRSVTANHVNKLVEHARRKLDVALSRYEWRAIKTLKGSAPEAKAFQFKPVEGVRWGVIEGRHPRVFELQGDYLRAQDLAP